MCGLGYGLWAEGKRTEEKFAGTQSGGAFTGFICGKHARVRKQRDNVFEYSVENISAQLVFLPLENDAFFPFFILLWWYAWLGLFFRVLAMFSHVGDRLLLVGVVRVMDMA